MRGVYHESGASRSLFIKPNLIFATWHIMTNANLRPLCQPEPLPTSAQKCARPKDSIADKSNKNDSYGIKEWGVIL